MDGSPARAAVQRLWARRWVRRVSYALVAGATLTGGLRWVADRPAVHQWALRRLDALVQEETGLPLAVGRLDLHPLQGTFDLYDLSLGGDLLTIRHAALHVDIGSLLGPSPRIHSLRVEQPRLVLTEAGLARLRLKTHPPRTGPLPQIRLDTFSLTGGEVVVPVAFRGIPELTYAFEAKAKGLGPNHVRLEWTGPRLAVKAPGGWERGRFDVIADLAEDRVELHEAYARLGETQLRTRGRFEPGKDAAQGRLEVHTTGLVDLVQAARWGGAGHAPLRGSLDVDLALQGTPAQPRWTLQAEGQDLRPGTAAFHPGDLRLKASGGLDRARLEHLGWESPQGTLALQGAWTAKGAVEAALTGRTLDLAALGTLLRVDTLAGVTAQVEGRVEGRLPAHGFPALDRWRGHLQVGLAQEGAPAGSLSASLDHGTAQVDELSLRLADLTLDGRGRGQVSAGGLRSFTADGETALDARQVAAALRAWKVVDLDMEGFTRASAQVRWNAGRPGGLELDGKATVSRPRWHGARADEVTAGVVQIRNADLSIRDIRLTKGTGGGGGQLWLTWGPTAPGAPQMDMCYTAFRLPIAEGLRAADVVDTEGKELPIQGTGSGWVRLVGPYPHLVMTGNAQAESSEAYGITLPAVSGSFWMDIPSLRMRLTDVRVAERPDLLGHGTAPPEGALALQGRADMDFDGWTWWIDLGGRLDTQALGFPGPRVQAQLDARLLGPITAPLGALDLPEGRIHLSRGRLFFGERSLEGLEGQASLQRGRLTASLGMEGMSRPIARLEVQQRGLDLEGTAHLDLSPESVQTGLLAQRLTGDLLEDLRCGATLQGRWHEGRELAWTGTLDRFAAQFSAFELHQTVPSSLRGDAQGATVAVNLEGGARGTVPGAAARVRLAGQVPFSTTAPLGLNLEGSADLAHLKTILDRLMEVDEYSFLSELTVRGTGRFDLLAHGTYPEPLLDGVVSLDHGQMSLRGYQGAEDLSAEVRLKDRTLALAEDRPLQGTLAHGELRATGSATWRPGGLDRYAFQATLDGFQLRDVPDGLDLQGSLRATLQGDDEGGVLRGTLRADRLTYQTEVKLADLILRSALSDTGGLGGLDLDDPLERIRLDLDLDLRAPWSFDTNLLKLEGRTAGPFQVVGTLGHPVPKGTLVFQPGGRLTNIFPAGDMVVDQGTLGFSEARPLDPLINLQGSVSSIPGYTVNLDIRGTLSNLSILPSSTPSLRQDEIVAILINPGNVANVGTAGATSGATQGAITQGLAGASSGLITTLAFAPFQEQLRRTLGLDRVNVAVRSTTLGGTETEVTLGKSINLLGQRSAFVVSHKKSGELSITSGQVEWRFGNLILQLGASKGGSSGLNPSGEIRHTWSPR